jgi:hypothetical protein
LAIAFAMLMHANRLNFGKLLRDRFSREFNEQLRHADNPAAATALAAQAAMARRGGATYTGQKTYEKKVITYLNKSTATAFSEAELQLVCDSLAELKAPKLLRKFFALGQRRFPTNPRFYLAEVDFQLAQPVYSIWAPRLSVLLDKVRELAQALPRGEREAMLELVRDRQEHLQELDSFGFGTAMPNPLDFFGEPDFGDGKEDWDDL